MRQERSSAAMSQIECELPRVDLDLDVNIDEGRSPRSIPHVEEERGDDAVEVFHGVFFPAEAA